MRVEAFPLHLTCRRNDKMLSILHADLTQMKLNLFRKLRQFMTDSPADKSEVQHMDATPKPAFNHPFFGTIEPVGQDNCYRSEVNGISVLFIDLDTDQLADYLEPVIPLFSKLTQIKDQMIAEMLPLKNSTWLEDGEPHLTKGEFDQLVAISHISVFEDRSSVVYYNDHNIFAGGAIVSSVKSNHVYDKSEIYG